MFWLNIHRKIGIDMIHGSTRKITVCSSKFYHVNSNFCCRHSKNFIFQETRKRLDAKYLKKNFLRRERLPNTSNIPEVIFSVDNSRKRIVGLDF